MTNAHFDIKRLSDEINELISTYGFNPYDEDDADIWQSALEGETSIDAVLDKLLAMRYQAKADEEAVKDRMNNLKARADRYKYQQEVLTNAMQKVLNMANLKSHKTIEATYTLRGGSTKVEIEDADAIPRQLCKVTYSPDKTMIKKALEQGEIVPGAALVTGPETISVRTK